MYAKNQEKVEQNSDDNYLYSNDSLVRFNRWMYKWVDSLKKQEFEKIIQKALSERQQGSWNLFSRDRYSENLYQELKYGNTSNSDILAHIFKSSDSFKPILFNILLQRMLTAAYFSKNFDNDAELVIQVSSDDARIRYYSQLLSNYTKVNDQVFCNKIAELQNSQLARLIQTPETNPLYSFFNYNNESRKQAFYLPLDIVLLINQHLGPNNIYYQEAKSLIQLERWPTNENEFQTYKVCITAIVDECINKVIELTRTKVNETKKDASPYVSSPCAP